MKPSQKQQPVVPQNDHTRLYFNVFMGLLALGLVYMIILLFTM